MFVFRVSRRLENSIQLSPVASRAPLSTSTPSQRDCLNSYAYDNEEETYDHNSLIDVIMYNTYVYSLSADETQMCEDSSGAIGSQHCSLSEATNGDR